MSRLPRRAATFMLARPTARPDTLGSDGEHAIMRQTRHRSVEVFRGYVRVASLFKNAAAAVGS